MQPKPGRSTATCYYGTILSGVVLGLIACLAAGWCYLESGDRPPTGRRIWDRIAADFVLPVCAIVGSTFGGLAGVVAATIQDRPARNK